MTNNNEACVSCSLTCLCSRSFSSCSALALCCASFSSWARWASSLRRCCSAMNRASSSLRFLSSTSRAIASSRRTLARERTSFIRRRWLRVSWHFPGNPRGNRCSEETTGQGQNNFILWCNITKRLLKKGVFLLQHCCTGLHHVVKSSCLFGETRYFQQQHQQTLMLMLTSDLFLCSCSRRSCSSLSRCSRACLRFSARARAASSGSLVPAEGLLVGAAGVEAAAAAAAAAAVVVVVVVVGAAEGAGLVAAAGEAAETVGSTLDTAGEAAETTGGLREGGVTGAEDTTMAGTSEETKRQRHSHEGGKIQVYKEHLKISEK